MFHVEQLAKLLEPYGVNPPAGFMERSCRHLDLVYQWNRVHDLTAIPEADALEKHALDSLLPFLRLPAPSSLLDVGTGAGFPGIQLALYWGGLTRVTLCEPLRKRRSFLELACATLDLDCAVIAEPLERVGSGPFALVTSRATLAWRELLDQARRHVTPEGQLMAMLGSKDRPPSGVELRADGWRELRVETYALPSGAGRAVLRAFPAT